MYVTYLAGGIASGKSSVARQLASLGASRVDLDALSRDALASGSPLLPKVAEAFGADLVDAGTGILDRSLLARRAFASPEATACLEAIELPEIGRLLQERLEGLRQQPEAPACAIVEVPLLDRVLATPDLAGLADEVACVTCPLETRRVRAQGRGMDPADFDRRAARQPDEAWLRAHADAVFDNAGTAEELAGQVRRWWDAHEARGWQGGRRA